MVAADEHKPDMPRPVRRKSGEPRQTTRPPVAALLFAQADRPVAGDLDGLSHASQAFAVTWHDDATGQAELFCDGLAFDCCGLAPGAALRMDSPIQQIALPGAFVAADHALVTIAAGSQLGGAGQLLPVVRMLVGLVAALGALPGLRAVAWLPARLAMSPEWFAEAIGIWLKGGPFPALALTSLVRSERGLASCGLAYFVGQEFVFAGKDGVLCESDARGAVRLTDWLVAHGPIDAPRTVDLAGFGKVRIEPDAPGGLLAHKL